MIVECFAPNGLLDALAQWTAAGGCRRHLLAGALPGALLEQLVWSALWLPYLPLLYWLGRRARAQLREWRGGAQEPD